jgi:hypothetical protein
LYYTDPAKYGRSCADCRRWVHDKDTGRRALDKTKRLPSGEQDPEGWLLMPPSSDPPCHDCGKTAGMDPKRRHWRFGPPDPPEWCYRVFRHWQRCRAVRWNTTHGADPIVKRNAALFEEVEAAHERSQQTGVLALLGLLKRK